MPYRAADDSLRTAHAALAERDRLRATREAVSRELTEAQGLRASLEEQLTDEQKDVRRYESGVWAFLYDLVADREARLSKEQKEAAAAQAKLAETSALCERMTDQVATIEKRLAELTGADADLAAARAGKEAVIRATGGSRADDLDAISADLGGLDAEGKEIDEAIAAGARAHASMARLVEALGSAQNWGTADVFSDSLFVTWIKRGRMDEADALAGVAQADLMLFGRELGDLGLMLQAETADLAQHHRFLDTWFDNIFTDLSVQSRIKQALAGADDVLREVGRRLDQLRSRRADTLTRSEQLSRRRLEILES